MSTLSALRARYLADTQGGRSAAPALARALEGIGWRAVGEPSAGELASHLVWLVDACVHEHRDPALLAHAVAALLRDNGPLLDGGLPDVAAYLPAAEDLLHRYVTQAVDPSGAY